MFDFYLLFPIFLQEGIWKKIHFWGSYKFSLYLSLHLVETSLDSRNHMYFVVTWQQICWNLNARPESNKVSVNKFTLQTNIITSFYFYESKTSRYISLNTFFTLQASHWNNFATYCVKYIVFYLSQCRVDMNQHPFMKLIPFPACFYRL